MKYENIYSAVFLDRPNRFIANIELDGKKTVCHVKNTGRCKELLLPGAEVYVAKADNSARKTAYDLIAVRKGSLLINMDSNAANIVFGEFLREGGLGFIPEYIKAEKTHKDSRFDFYFEYQGRKAFAEVKGVTLEQNGIARFPDAPTERGIKHLKGLMNCAIEGYDAYAVFVIQMKGVKRFEANTATHPEFAATLKKAHESGVKLLSYDCIVTPDSLAVNSPVEIKI